jgi:hypothetical protein
MAAIPFLESAFYGILLPDLAGLSGTAGEIREHTAGYSYLVAHERHHRRILAERYGL